MSVDGKSSSDGDVVLKPASSEAHSLQMSMETGLYPSTFADLHFS